MIRSFGGKETERLWRRERDAIDPRIHRVALRKLRQVGSAEVLEDLRVPPGNRLEALKGDRAGQHGIRINDRWRICNEIVHGKRGITADTALRLAKYFGTSAEFWINLLSQVLRDVAGRAPCEPIFSVINARNLASIDLHLKLGFVEVRRSPSYAGIEFTGGEGVLLRHM